ILSVRVFVFIGLISYSLYLWHWPILSFYRYAIGEIRPFVGLVLFLIMIILSVLSYRFIERPFRNLRMNFQTVLSKPVFTGAFVILLLCAGLLLTKGYGLYYFSENYREKLAYLEPAPAAFTYSYVCQAGRVTAPMMTDARCIINGSEEPSVLLWGDSNASHYIGVLG